MALPLVVTAVRTARAIGTAARVARIVRTAGSARRAARAGKVIGKAVVKTGKKATVKTADKAAGGAVIETVRRGATIDPVSRDAAMRPVMRELANRGEIVVRSIAAGALGVTATEASIEMAKRARTRTRRRTRRRKPCPRDGNRARDGSRCGDRSAWSRGRTYGYDARRPRGLASRIPRSKSKAALKIIGAITGR